MEELLLVQAEEALHRGVVGAAALGRHAPDQAVPLAYRYPARPAVVHAAVGVDHGALAGRQPGARVRQRRVREVGVRVLARPPGDDRGVEAVPDGGQVHLAARRQPELGYVGEPQEVRQSRAEVAAHEVRRGGGHLAAVGAVGAGPPPPPALPAGLRTSLIQRQTDVLPGPPSISVISMTVSPAPRSALALSTILLLYAMRTPFRTSTVQLFVRSPLSIPGHSFPKGG